MVDFNWARILDDEAWKKLLASGESPMPPMPSVTVQEMFVGSSGASAFNEAAIFWNLTKKVASELGRPIDSDSSVLDVGVGWGRLYRWVLRDLRASQIKGIDIDPATIEMCSEMMPFGNFELIEKEKSYPEVPGGWDLAYFYSVFSHLSEPNALSVLNRTLAVLKPGGIIALTTLLMRHVDVWASQIDQAAYSVALKKAGFDRQDWWERAAEGEHLYVPIGGGDLSRPEDDYGEAVVPKGWWASVEGCRLVSFERRSGLPQAYVVLQKL